ncbi:MAG: hypothetical protein PF495_12470 [Spirochaetales bacterium]|jgi:hypothetical protein|nr:hypothetical protein [Spirochaetales bacterium]
MLPISEYLYLMHSSSAGEGKTKGMAKGLTLFHQNDVFAGECAGFGLPVIKTDNLTIFPSLFSSRVLKPGTVETVYHLNLMDAWQISGIPAPTFLNVFMGKIVSFYMKRPKFQQTGLKIRNAIFTFLQIRSAMKPGKSFGYCRVLYQIEDHRLKISVNGQSLQHHDELILLNEVPGIGFSRMKSNRDIREGNNFLPWQPCTIDTAIENPALHIGFHLSFPDVHSVQCVQIAAGKEVGRNLNWDGLSITTKLANLTYHVNFKENQ